MRVFTPPRPVLVDMGSVWSFAFPVAGAPAVTLTDRAYGLRVEPWQTGTQLAWAKSAHGVWIAAVLVPIASANGRVQVRPCLWVPAAAIALPRPGA